MDSKRTKAFKSLFTSLPDLIKENARKQYKLFLENQSHPSLRKKQVGSTRNNRFKVYEVTVGMGYRATSCNFLSLQPSVFSLFTIHYQLIF